MKKSISLLLSLCLALSLFVGLGNTTKAHADEYLSATDIRGIQWNYSIVDGNAVELHPADPAQIVGQIIIPDELDGVPVTKIKSYAFRGNTDITGVIMNDNIVDIGESTFDMCTSLTLVQLSNNITHLKTYVFDGCHALQTINMPENLVAVGHYAFYDCPRLDYVRLPESLRHIGVEAFIKCTALTEIYIDSTDVTFADSSCAFDADDVIHVYGGANFLNYLEEHDIEYIDHGYTDNPSASSDIEFTMNTTDVSVTVPLYVLCQVNPNTEGNRGFLHGDANVSNNAQVPIDMYLTFFGQGVNANRQFILPEEIRTVAGTTWDKLDATNTAKYMSLGLKPENNWYSKALNDYTYANSTLGKTKVGTIGGGQTASLDFTAYYGKCVTSRDAVNVRMIFIAELAQVDIESNQALFTYEVTDNYDPAIEIENKQVVGAVMVKGLDSAVAATTDVSRVKIPNIVTIDDKHYEVTSIAADAFAGIDTNTETKEYNIRIKEMRLPSTLESIGISAFRNCDSLEYIDIPSSVTAIGENAFNGRKKLKYVYVQGGPAVGIGCFNNIGDDSSVVYVYDPELKSTLLSNKYTNNSNVRLLSNQKTPIEVIDYGNTTMTLYKENGENYALFSGVGTCGEFLETDSQMLESMFNNNGGHVTVIVDSGLTDVGTNMFKNMTAVDTVIIGKDVARIQNNAFENSTIKRVQTEATNILRNIGREAFKNCSQLEQFSFPHTVNYIGGSAFLNCTKLKHASISQCSGIYTSTFEGCTSLEFVYGRGSEMGDYSFNGTSANIYLTNAAGVDFVNSQKGDNTYTVTHVNASDKEQVGNVFYDQAVKSLWVWGNVSLDDYQDCIDFMTDKGLNRLYKSISLEDFTTAEGKTKIEQFVEDFNTAGIEVWWANGDKAWGIHEYCMINVIDIIADYNETAVHKIAGINFDIEVHTFNDFSSRPEYYVDEYVECCKNAYEYAETLDVKIIQTISSWLVNTYTDKITEIIDTACDGITVMNYKTGYNAAYNNFVKTYAAAKKAAIPMESICTVDIREATTDTSYGTFEEAVEVNKQIAADCVYADVGFSYHHYGIMAEPIMP